jgi:hypothetical protein
MVLDSRGELQAAQWCSASRRSPIAEEDQQGISVLVHGKLAHRPFTFQLGAAPTGQLGLE